MCDEPKTRCWKADIFNANINSEFAFLLKLSSALTVMTILSSFIIHCFGCKNAAVVCCCLSKRASFHLFTSTKRAHVRCSNTNKRAPRNSSSTRKSHLGLCFQIGFIVVQFYYIHIKHPIKCEFKLKQMRYSSVCLIYKRWAYRRKIFAYGCNFKCRLHLIPCMAVYRSLRVAFFLLCSTLTTRAYLFARRAHRGLYSEFYALAFFPTSFRFASAFLFNVVGRLFAPSSVYKSSFV